jgi:RNA 2',3'-cyclic 3'-phosphodiesterase
MRVFMALRPPEGALEELREAAAPVRRAHPRLRWTKSEDQHLTVHFLGEHSLGEHSLGEQSLGEGAGAWLGALDEPARHSAARCPAPALRLSGVGQFPQQAPRQPQAPRARVLWTGVEGELDALHHLHTELAAALTESGLQPEERPYIPHLTLARARGRPIDLGEDMEPLRGFRGTTWRAGRVELLASQPDSEPRYRVLAAWDLQWNEQGEESPAPAHGEHRRPC